MNVTVLKGRLCADPETRYAGQGGDMAVCRFRLAVDRMRQGEADFIGCLAFQKTAEFIGKYFRKGDMIALSGRIQTGSYDAKDGRKVYTTEVVAERAEFCGGKADRGQTASGNRAGEGFMDIPGNAGDEGLPFV